MSVQRSSWSKFTDNPKSYLSALLNDERHTLITYKGRPLALVEPVTVPIAENSSDHVFQSIEALQTPKHATSSLQVLTAGTKMLALQDETIAEGSITGSGQAHQLIGLVIPAQAVNRLTYLTDPMYLTSWPESVKTQEDKLEKIQGQLFEAFSEVAGAIDRYIGKKPDMSLMYQEGLTLEAKKIRECYLSDAYLNEKLTELIQHISQKELYKNRVYAPDNMDWDDIVLRTTFQHAQRVQKLGMITGYADPKTKDVERDALAIGALHAQFLKMPKFSPSGV